MPASSDETLYRVTAPAKGKSLGFCAGAVVKDGKVVDAPPILKYCKGHPARWLEQYAELKGWQIMKVPMLKRDPDHG